MKNRKDQTTPLDRPVHFYKYTYIDETQLDHAKDIFARDELYFASASKFNDPFDCTYRVHS